MGYLTEIRRQLAPELQSMNELICDMLATRHEVINKVVTDYLVTKGKQIRPVVVMLSARIFGDINPAVIQSCAALEMLHNSSLIHDDVVDETKLRRGNPTMNASWGNHIAVLVGDYFISNALRAGLMTRNLKIIEAMASLGKELAVGEIDQACNVRYHQLDEQSYFSMIHKKTASLFIHCVQVGAEAVGAAPGQYEPLMKFGELLGLCFQIKDDIFDYSADQERIGKPTGNDLREGKVTLPLIHALHAAPEEESAPMRRLLTEKEELSDADIAALIEFARSHGGIDYAFHTMRRMQADAGKYLDVYPDSPWKTHFREIFEYIISRDN